MGQKVFPQQQILFVAWFFDLHSFFGVSQWCAALAALQEFYLALKSKPFCGAKDKAFRRREALHSEQQQLVTLTLIIACSKE